MCSMIFNLIPLKSLRKNRSGFVKSDFERSPLSFLGAVIISITRVNLLVIYGMKELNSSGWCYTTFVFFVDFFTP